MKRWTVAIYAIGAALLMSCGDDDSSKFLPVNPSEEDDGVSSSSGSSSSEKISSGKDSSQREKNLSSSYNRSSSSGGGNSSVSISTDTSSFLDTIPVKREFSYVIENFDMKLDLKALTVTDKRDGQVYDVEWKDSTVIMVQYMNYDIPEKSWCYNDYEKNCEKFGRIYSLKGAFCPDDGYPSNAPQGPCPLGWRTTTTLSPLGYPGYMENNVFTQMTRNGLPWSAGAVGDNSCSFSHYNEGFAVRCYYDRFVVAPDSVTKPKPKEFTAYKMPADLPTYTGPYGEFVDIRDGEIYKTVDIGNQTWFAENLRYKQSGYDTPKDGNILMGYLYDFKTAAGVESYNREKRSTPYQGVCPKGWHIPTAGDWQELFDYVLDRTDGVSLGKPLRSTDDWQTEEPAGTNSFGFNVIPAGGRYQSTSAGATWTSYTGPYYNMYFLLADDTYRRGYRSYVMFPNAEDDAEPRILVPSGDKRYSGYVRCVKGDGFRTIVYPEEDEPVKGDKPTEGE